MSGLLGYLSGAEDSFANYANNNPASTMAAGFLPTLGYMAADRLGGRRLAPFGAGMGGAAAGYMTNPQYPFTGAAAGGAIGFGGANIIHGMENLGQGMMNQFPNLPGHLMLEGVNQGARALGNYFMPQNSQPQNNTTMPFQNNTQGFL